MHRIKINLPEKFIFKTEIQVRITDLNYGNHLANDRLLGIIHEARVRFFQSIGCGEMNVFGSGLILADSVIIYKGQGFYDDILHIEIAISDIHKYGCDVFYKITNKENGNDIADAKTGILFFDYQTQKLSKTPNEFLELINNKINES